MIAHKKYLEILIPDTFSMHNMVETIFARQSMRSSKFGRYVKQQAWRGPWRGVR